MTHKKEQKEIGKCKHCGAAIYLTEEGGLLIKQSYDCIHEPEFMETEVGNEPK